MNDPKLGLPNPTSQCSTCGAQDTKLCDGVSDISLISIKNSVTISGIGGNDLLIFRSFWVHQVSMFNTPSVLSIGSFSYLKQDLPSM